ncbi:MAG: hypothetical protein WC604_02975, partial [Candidatus Gracilibacteria bacterium]
LGLYSAKCGFVKDQRIVVRDWGLCQCYPGVSRKLEIFRLGNLLSGKLPDNPGKTTPFQDKC